MDVKLEEKISKLALNSKSEKIGNILLASLIMGPHPLTVLFGFLHPFFWDIVTKFLLPVEMLGERPLCKNYAKILSRFNGA